MRILIATGLYPPEIGGPATYANLLADELPKRGFKVDVLPFSVVRRFPPLVRHIVYFAKTAVRARKADAVFVQDTVSTGLPALFAAKLFGKPLVLRVPGDYAWEQGVQRFGVSDSCDDFQKKSYGLRVAFLRFVQRLVARSATIVIAPSTYFAAIVLRWGVPKERLHIIYNPVDVPTPVAPPRVPEGHILVSVGRLMPWKGFGTLIDLMKELEGWHLVIIGDGPFREELHAHALQRGVADRVTFTGRLSRAEVIGWYKAAHAFVLNTSFESFSFQVVEALAAGVPVVATSIGSLPEIVEDGVEGRLVKPDDVAELLSAIKSVPEEKDVWQRRIVAGQRKAEEFLPETIVGKLVEIFRSI